MSAEPSKSDNSSVEHAKQASQWAMIGCFAAYLGWIGTERLAPALGYELAARIFVLVGIFVVVDAMRLGERVASWYATKHKRGSALMRPRSPAVLLAASALLLSTAHALAQGSKPTISVDSLQREATHWKAIVRITNGTRQSFGLVGFRCTFLHQGKAVDSSGNVALNVGAGETVFDKVLGPYSDKPVDAVTCRISYANL